MADCNDGKAALALISENQYDLVITDISMQPVDGFEILKHVQLASPQTPVIMITGFASIESAVKAMDVGCFDYVTKPFKFQDLIQTVQRALSASSSGHGSAGGKQEVQYYFHQLVGNSRSMRKIYQAINSLAVGKDNIAIIGEPGTGKTQIARAIHLESRPNHSFYPVECDRSAEELDKEIFKDRNFFQRVHRGTIYLHNIQAMDKAIQGSLLYLLQNGMWIKDAAGKKIEADLRFIVSANDDLQMLVQQKILNEELYYRLSPVSIDVLPLREHIEDLPLLIQHFLNVWEQDKGQSVEIAEEACQILENYDWPGNIAELENIIQVAAFGSENNRISNRQLPPKMLEKASSTTRGDENAHRWRSLKQFLKDKEKEYVLKVLEQAGNDRSRAAGMMNMDLETFEQRYGNIK